MTRFRPCIDLHAGRVKQIVGGTLGQDPSTLQTNFVSPFPPSHFAALYRDQNLTGAHVIMLGPGNADAARESLAAWPGGLQVGGGITASNARYWIEEVGADKVIVTSYLFPLGSSDGAGGGISQERLDAVLEALGGDKERLVIDLSCRRVSSSSSALRDGERRNEGKEGEEKKEHPKWFVATNKWQTITTTEVNAETIARLEPYCSEFLIHAADNEGLQRGIDEDLVGRLAEWCSIPVTYAGGGRNLDDLELVKRLSGGKVDLTIGSALDCFGGTGVTLAECVKWNRRQEEEEEAAAVAEKQQS